MKRSSLEESGRVVRLGPLRLALGQMIGDEGCPFMKRWVLIHDNGAGIRVHRFMPNHYEHVAHDHPFAFLTIVLRGGYVDISKNGDAWVEDHMGLGSIRYRPAHHAHKTRTDHRGAWTFVVNGPKTRMWGFIDKLGRWVRWTDFDGRRAACEDIMEDK